MKYLITILIICLLLGSNTVWATNTKSLSLDGTTQYAYAADSVSLSFTGDFTVEAWIKLDRLPSTAEKSFVLASKFLTTDNNRSWFVYIEGDDKLLIYYNWNGVGGQATSIYTTNAIVVADDVGHWVHIAAATDVSAQTAQVWKNGSAVSVGAGSGLSTAIFDGTAQLKIGNGYTDNSFLDGLMDEVRIWNDIRSEAEIQANYQKELNGDEAGLVTYYKFNDSALDETANNNDLTLVNSPTYSTDVPFSGAVALPPSQESDIIFFE